MQNKNGIIYLDNAATTPMSNSTILHLARICNELYGNPSSAHEAGQKAMAEFKKAQTIIAGEVGCEPWEIFFTSGGTEADNWALKGVLHKGDHLIISSIEHHAILNTARYLESQGIEVTYVDPTPDGLIHLKDIISARKPNTKLISLMLVNNEVGTIQPVEEVAEWAKSENILVHTDAVQAVGHMPIDLSKLRVDFLSASAHKFGGLKNSGFLFIRHSASGNIEPMLHGGSQQYGMRSGTLDPISASVMADALEQSNKSFIKDSTNIDAIWSMLVNKLLCIEGISLNGSINIGRRLHNNINIRIKGVDAESLVASLSEQGVYISAGAACSSGNRKPSHVLKAMGMNDRDISESVRITLGSGTTTNDITEFIDKIAIASKFLRREG